MSSPIILIVEDEYLIRLTLAEALVEDGFDVIEAASGDEALILMQQHLGISLLLTDVQLPGQVDGLALARAARVRAPDLPVIFVTGRPEALPAADLTERDGFIAKPYLPSEVCAAVRRLIGG
jgi:DNA-binding response OmpR family regulator